MVKYKIVTKELNFWYGENHALKDIDISIPENTVTAIMGPSGCGKSTLLRCFNRLNDLVDGTQVKGEVLLDGEDIYRDSMDVFLAEKKGGDGISKGEPFPQDHL